MAQSGAKPHSLRATTLALTKRNQRCGDSVTKFSREGTAWAMSVRAWQSLAIQIGAAGPRQWRCCLRRSFRAATSPHSRVIASSTEYKLPESDREIDDSSACRAGAVLWPAPADQAKATTLLLTNRLSRTTGQIIAVVGSLHEAFLR